MGKMKNAFSITKYRHSVGLKGCDRETYGITMDHTLVQSSNQSSSHEHSGLHRTTDCTFAQPQLKHGRKRFFFCQGWLKRCNCKKNVETLQREAFFVLFPIFPPGPSNAHFLAMARLGTQKVGKCGFSGRCRRLLTCVAPILTGCCIAHISTTLHGFGFGLHENHPKST